MKKSCLLLFVIFLCYSHLLAQEGFNLPFAVGYSFQNKTSADQSDFYDTNTLGIRLGVTYQKTLTNKFLVEAGLIGRYNRGQKETELVNFISHNFRMQFPIYLGLKTTNKVIIKAGIGIENNRDLKNLDFFRKDHNLRLDFLTKIDYIYSRKILFNLYSNWSMSNAPNVYTINSPDNGIYLGITYHLK